MLLTTPNALISESLAPAVAISGSALMTMGLLNRLAHLGSRVRQLNKEFREGQGSDKLDNIRLQTAMVLNRARMVRNALIMLYIAIACMVLTAFALALQALSNPGGLALLPVWTFLLGLLGIFSAVLQEIFEVVLALKALKLDVLANTVDQ